MSVKMNSVDHRRHVHVSQAPGIERREVMVEDIEAKQRYTLDRITALVAFLLSLLEGMIGLRILLMLMEANPRNVFASWIYNFTALFLTPFRDLTINPIVGSIVLELTSIIAMIVYALVAWGIVQLIWLVFYHPSARSVTTFERDNSRRDDHIS